MDIVKTLAEELSIKTSQVEAVLSLLKEGDTIPFIARYRKEKTGSLDDETLRKFDERYAYLLSLEDRRKTIIDSINEQGKMTDELLASIEEADKLSVLENLYRPYKKKRKTKASIAKDAGLEPLAKIILAQRIDEEALFREAASYINPDKGIADEESALKGAGEIIAEMMGDNSSYYTKTKEYIERTGRLESKETKEDTEKEYLTYAKFSAPVKAIKPHQTLAINRGEKEKKLSVSFSYDSLTMVNAISRDYLIARSPLETRIRDISLYAFKHFIEPSVETEIRSALFTIAEDSSIVLFKANLKQLLLEAPLKGHRILGFDPAFVNGCKIATIDEEGKLLHIAVIYPTVGGASRIKESADVLVKCIIQDKIDYIALGNGTASRESEAFIKKTLEENNLKVRVVIVSESGASVYSASALGTEEFPDLTVEKRSAISLARRLLDPLSELVKIDPYSMGVGQYQHDMDKKKLTLALAGVVEGSVNAVGVYLNYASPSLLSYVSGIGPTLAKGIVAYREANGPFKSRKDLLKVPHLGAKAYEQCAGFLRIADGYFLDNTGVHPESYKVALAIMKIVGLTPDKLGSEEASKLLSSLPLDNYQNELGVGKETVIDIVEELKKPGRDPREEASTADLDNNVTSIADLKVGMILKGTVRNVMDFGAFVDIGVHQDGLVHISELSSSFVKSPFDVVSIGKIVKVKVISVDPSRKRIGLSIKQAE